MKILLYGEALQPGSGVWCYHDMLGRMGHEVEHFDSFAALEHYLSHPLWRGYQRLTRRVAEHHRREHARRLIARAAELRPEIVFVLKGLFLGSDDVLALKKTGAWVMTIARPPAAWAIRFRISASSNRGLSTFVIESSKTTSVPSTRVAASASWS